MKTFRRRLLPIVRVLLLVYLGILLLLACFQRKLIFLSTRAGEEAQLREAVRLGVEPWRDAEGGIIGWRGAAKNPPAANRLLVFHGNAGYALMRGHFRRGFEALDGGKLWEVVLFEYPGYGSRAGSPSEAAIDEAAGAALRQLLAEDDRPIYLAGESLGSGPACHLAGELPEKVAGLLLITPYTTLPDVAAVHYRFLPVRLLMRDRFDNVAALEKYRGPLGVILADRDEVVTTPLGQKLFDSYSGPKFLEMQVDAGHNDIDFDPHAGWWRSMSDFLLGAS